MAHNTDWDVDYYKTDYESDEHWELRRSFMLKHKDKFPEDELVCLAQVFTNVEFLGCRYPEATMRRVGLLSQEVAAEFRASRAGKLKRTFVGAQDAAGAKAKARSGGNSSQSSKKSAPDYTKPVRFVSASTSNNDDDDDDTAQPKGAENASATLPSHYKAVQFVGASATPDPPEDAPSRPPKLGKTNAFAGESKHRPDLEPQTNNQSRPGRLQRRHQPQLRLQKQRKLPQHNNPYNGFILFDPTVGPTPTKSVNLLQSSAAKQRRTLTATLSATGGCKSCTVSLDGVPIADATGETNQEAKELAHNEALKVLQKDCYTIRRISHDLRSDTVAQRITTEAGRANSDAQLTSDVTNNYAANRLTSNNVGFKMLQSLGWSGGGLGNDGDGRNEPVAIEMQLNRAGLGMGAATAANEQLNHRFMVECLRDYVNDVDNIHELVFSEDFTKEERAKLHQMAAKHSLNSKSKNTPEGGRYLVLSKKVGLQQLATDVYNGGMYATRYTLEPPTG